MPPTTAFLADRLFDGRSVLADHAVIVGEGYVTEVVPSVHVPADLPVIHEPGCTLLPGLIDTHMHCMGWMGPQFLASGVTTVRDTGNPLRWILQRREQWDHALWPRILCTGPLLDGPVPLHPHVARACAELSDAVAAVRETAAAGVDGIKLYNRLNPDWLPDMVEQAHLAGLKASMHCQSSGVLVAVAAGVDEVHHLDGIVADLYDGSPPGWLEVWGTEDFARRGDRLRDLADSLAASDVAVTPTLAYWHSQWRLRTAGHASSDELRRVPPKLALWQAPEPDPATAQQWRRALVAAQGFIGLLRERGVTVLAGSDTPCGPIPPGRSLWRELALLTGAAMSPLEVLRAATAEAADFLDRPDLGRLEPGAAADMVFVRDSPLEAIPDPPDIALIVQGGVVHRPEDLWAAAEGPEFALDEEEPWARQFRAHSRREKEERGGDG